MGFYDFVFGPSKIPGVPPMDLMMAVGVLKELDAGSDEQILLTSSEGAACLVSSFEELAFALEEAYHEFLFKPCAP